MMQKTIKEEQVLGKVMSTDLDMLSLSTYNVQIENWMYGFKDSAEI